MIMTIHLNSAELKKYQEYLDKSAQDNNEYAEVYKVLADQMREQCKPGFVESKNDGVTRITASVDDYGAFDLEFGYDVKTSLALMDLMIEHRSVFTRVSEFVMAGIKMIGGLSDLFKKAGNIVEARKAEYRELHYPHTGTND